MIKKFKAWDTELNKWINESNKYPFYIIGETTMFNLLEQYSIKKFNNILVLQFTGLTDKYKKEIFEGDLLLFPDTESEYTDVGIANIKVAETDVNGIAEVTFQNGAFGLLFPKGTELVEPGFYSFDYFQHLTGYSSNDLELINSKYEEYEKIII